MDYTTLIPDQAPAGLVDFLRREEGKFGTGVLGYKYVARDYADALARCDDFGGDFRTEKARESSRKGRGKAAQLWCSECDSEAVAEYIQAKSCKGCVRPSGIYLQDDVQQTSAAFANGEDLLCPCCGAPVRLRSADSLPRGYTEQEFVVAATVNAGCLVLTEYCVERYISFRREEIRTEPFYAYVVDGKKIVRLAQHQRTMSGAYTRLEKWEQRKRMVDNLGAPLFYNKLPSLDGTTLENSKLWEYYRQAYYKGYFYPLGYLRLYLRRPAVENLITADMGDMIGQAIGKETAAGTRYGSMMPEYKSPQLSWIDWRQARPAQMLGLTKEQLRRVKKEEWDLDALVFWIKNKTRLKFDTAEELLKLTHKSTYMAQSIMDCGQPPIKTARYCKKQGNGFNYLQDYWRMAVAAGMNLDQPEVRWPSHLTDAHNRAMEAQKCKASLEQREAFARIAEKCSGLCWEHDGICIRPARTPDELVEEGNTLHHCVGGYAKTHMEGKIILFIRHTRRPERSWFTLNVDLATKRIIQNHGYKNEMVNGKILKIPRRVEEFVTLWKKEVLKPWTAEKPKKNKLPQQKKAAA